MAGFLTTPGRSAALDAIVANGAYVGLAHTIPNTGDPTLANVYEVTTDGYSRQAVSWTAAVDSDPVRVVNVGAVTFGPMTTDMDAAAYAFITDTQTGNVLPPPTSLAAGTPTSGGNSTAGTYTWAVTAVNINGETVVSNTASSTVTASKQVPLTWAAVAGATGYNVYRYAGTNAAAWVRVNGTSPIAGTSYSDTFNSSIQTTDAPPATSSASVGKVFYVWELVEPVAALANKPVYLPSSGLVIE